MNACTPEERAYLLKLARSTIASSLSPPCDTADDTTDTFPSLLKKRGCFVTLHKDGGLRGCIGTIEPVDSVLTCVKKNALNAAFNDPRFPSLTLEELNKINIEISILTLPKALDFTDGEDLKNQLRPGIHGVILSQGWRSATFLPQVWEQLPDKSSFLSNLCLKAGLPGHAWQDKKTDVKVYQVEYFSE